MMSWKDRLKSAQWRGIVFLTESHEAKEGRRLAVHELPGGDVPVVEDLGAKAQIWRVQAYFLGADYDRARDRFLVALRTPGADWLTHPWLGRVWARAQDWSTSETNAEGGMAKVSIEFVASGAGVPQPQPDLVDAAQRAVDRYTEVSTSIEPEAMGMGAVAAFVARVQEAMGQVRTLLSRARLPLTMTRQVLAQVDSALALWQEARDLPPEYRRLMRSVATVLGQHGGDLTRTSGNVAAARSVGDAARLRAVAALCKCAPTPAGVLIAAAGENALTGVDRAALIRNAAAEQAARAHWSAAMAMQMSLADYDTADGRDQALAAAQAAVANALAVADVSTVRRVDGLAAERFEAAMYAQAAVQRALRAQALAPTQTRQVVAPLPSVVLAYRMGVDEAVLLARNGVRHPLFVQGVVRV